MADLKDHPTVVELGKRIAQRELLRREHNAWVGRPGQGDYLRDRFRPLSLLLNARINSLTDAADADVVAQTGVAQAGKSGRLVTPPGLTKMSDRASAVWLARRSLAGLDVDDERRRIVDSATGDVKSELRLANLSAWSLPEKWIGGTPLPDPYVDFSSGWTKQDASGRYSSNASRITTTGQARSDNNYSVADYGAGHFGNYDHLLETYISGGTGTAGSNRWFGIWAVVNGAGSWQNLASGQTAYHYVQDDTHQAMACWDRGNAQYDLNVGLDGSAKYVEIVRSSTTFTLYIRTGSHTGTLVDTLTMTCQTTTWRYLQNAFSRYATGTDTISGWTQNLDLQEAATGGPFPHFIRRSCGLTGGLCPC
jgi:hypothetical protein